MSTRPEHPPADERHGDSPRPGGAELLSRQSASADRDGQELYAWVARRVRERALLLEIDQVWRAARARLSTPLHPPLARERITVEGSRGEIPAWVRGHIDHAIDGSIRAQERAQQNASFSLSGGISPLAERESFAGWLADNLGMEWNQTQAAVSAFNRLPEDVRRTFVDLVCSSDPPGRGYRTLSLQQSRHVRQALATLMCVGTLDRVSDGTLQSEPRVTREVAIRFQVEIADPTSCADAPPSNPRVA